MAEHDLVLLVGDGARELAARARVFLLDMDGTLYLGDTQGDLDACREAGVPFLFAAYGFGSVDASIPRIEALDDLPEYLAGKVRLGEKGQG